MKTVETVLPAGKIVEINIYPSIYVMTDLSATKMDNTYIYIAFAGVIFPFVISMLSYLIKSNNVFGVIGVILFKVQCSIQFIYFVIVIILNVPNLVLFLL